MKNNLPYQDLQEITSLLVSRYQPEKIFCFSSLHYHLNTASGCFLQSGNRHSQYFLLLETREITRVEHQAQDLVNHHFKGGAITLIAHGKETIEEAINNHSRFFISVYRHAVLLYTAGGFGMTFGQQYLPEIDPVQTHQKAIRHFRHRYIMAAGFMQAAELCMRRGYFNNTVFLLHQATEQCCIALIRVFIAYRSDMHNLDRLLKLSQCFSAEPSAVFPRETHEEKRLFSLFHKSYSDARYKLGFKISGEDAAALLEKCREFAALTERLCLQKIEEFGLEAGGKSEYRHTALTCRCTDFMMD